MEVARKDFLIDMLQDSCEFCICLFFNVVIQIIFFYLFADMSKIFQSQRKTGLKHLRKRYILLDFAEQLLAHTALLKGARLRTTEVDHSMTMTINQ